MTVAIEPTPLPWLSRTIRRSLDTAPEAASKGEIDSVKAAQAKRSADKEAARLARKRRELEEIETIMAKKEGTKAAPSDEKAQAETKKEEVAKTSSSGSAVECFVGTFVGLFKKIISLLMFWKK